MHFCFRRLYRGLESARTPACNARSSHPVVQILNKPLDCGMTVPPCGLPNRMDAGMAAIWPAAPPQPVCPHHFRRLSRSSLSPYLYIPNPSSPPLGFPRAHLGGIRSLRCFAGPRGGTGAPPLLKMAVGGVTELLRLFSSDKQRSASSYRLLSYPFLLFLIFISCCSWCLTEMNQGLDERCLWVAM